MESLVANPAASPSTGASRRRRWRCACVVECLVLMLFFMPCNLVVVRGGEEDIICPRKVSFPLQFNTPSLLPLNLNLFVLMVKAQFWDLR